MRPLLKIYSPSLSISFSLWRIKFRGDLRHRPVLARYILYFSLLLISTPLLYNRKGNQAENLALSLIFTASLSNAAWPAYEQTGVPSRFSLTKSYSYPSSYKCFLKPAFEFVLTHYCLIALLKHGIQCNSIPRLDGPSFYRQLKALKFWSRSSLNASKTRSCS